MRGRSANIKDQSDLYSYSELNSPQLFGSKRDSVSPFLDAITRNP